MTVRAAAGAQEDPAPRRRGRGGAPQEARRGPDGALSETGRGAEAVLRQARRGLPGEGATFTWAGVRAGSAGAGAVAASVFAYGLAFGVLAHQHGLPLAAAVLMSGTVYAGSAQIVALQVWAAPVPLIAVWIAALAINARYVLMGAALRPWFAALTRLRAYGSLFVMGDGNWA